MCGCTKAQKRQAPARMACLSAALNSDGADQSDKAPVDDPGRTDKTTRQLRKVINSIIDQHASRPRLDDG